MHAFYTWCVLLEHRIQYQQSRISALIGRQYVLRTPKVLLTSKHSEMREPGRGSTSFRRAPL